MADAKIEIKVGAFSLTGEGTEKWLSGELEKLLAKIPELVEVAPADDGDDNAETGGGGKAKKRGKVGTLSAFLKEKNATSNQVKELADPVNECNGDVSEILPLTVLRTLIGLRLGKAQIFS